LEQNKKDVWNSFFSTLSNLKDIIKPYAERSGICAESAILLTVYSEFPDLSISVRDEFVNELKSKGFIKLEGNKPTVTSKGAILAKSFIQVRKQFFK